MISKTILSRYFILSFIFSLFVNCRANSSENSAYNQALQTNYKELSELMQGNGSANQGNINFVNAAAISTPCVVHIITKTSVTKNYVSPFQDMFGNEFLYSYPKKQEQQASGSGVIISPEGYIVTNFHVVQNAEYISVVLRNKNEYKAKVVGVDKDTDLAIIKIEEKNLPALKFANSDDVRVGEWVLAVGNPFNLESTVTQGIVSAKGRSLDMGNQVNKNPIESFIQTDAAVNPGNSGGALVNLNGELIGINTAIASPTGTYAGYAFAVPSNIVKKVIEDIKDFGSVQRAYLGISASAITSDDAKQLGLNSMSGVLVRKVYPNSAASEVGLKDNDVIVKLDEKEVASFPELLEYISVHRPGDEINIAYVRNGKLENVQARLKNKFNNTETVTNSNDRFDKLGIQLAPLPDKYKRSIGINGGLVVKITSNGVIRKNTQMKDGFVIVTINGQPVKTVEEFNDILNNTNSNEVNLDGFYLDKPYKYQYSFKIN